MIIIHLHFNPLVEADSWRPSEGFSGAPVVHRLRLLDVVLDGVRDILWNDALTEGEVEFLDDVIERMRHARADLIDRVVVPRARGQYQGGHNIGHVHEVPTLAPVAVDYGYPVALHVPQELGEAVGVFPLVRLSRTIDGEEPHPDPLQATLVLVCPGNRLVYLPAC